MVKVGLSLALLATIVLVPSLAVAQDNDQDQGDDQARRWGMTIWGLSYHINKNIDYAAGNWGLGLRFYIKPRHFFVEADALRNSNRGLVLPISAGAEIGVGTIGLCRFSALAALTAAYYQNPRRNLDQVK